MRTGNNRSGESFWLRRFAFGNFAFRNKALPVGLAALFIVAALPSSAKSDLLVLDVDLTGYSAFGFVDDERNTRETFNIGARSEVVNVEYINLEFEAFAPSWIHEFVISVNNSDATTFWDWNPGVGMNNPGIFSGSGSFVNPGLYQSGPFQVHEDGDLLITVYDTFNDDVAPNATVNTGTLRVTYNTVPEPSMVVFLGCGVVALIATRRVSRRIRRRSV